jgi:hypothetical protein
VEVRVFGAVELVDEGSEIRLAPAEPPGVEQCLALLESEAAGGQLSESG